MLNLIKKNFFTINKFNLTDVKGFYKINKPVINKYHPPISQEWNNSVYYFNKNTTKPLPVLNKIIFNLIKNYFNLTFIIRDKILSSRRRIRFKRISTKRIFLSKAIIKYTNKKIFIFIYTYNREKIFLRKKLVKLYKKLKYKKFRIRKKTLKKIFRVKKIQNIKYTYYNNIVVKNFLKKKIKKEKLLLLNIIKYKYTNMVYYKYFFRKFYIRYTNKILENRKLFIYYNKILLLNNYKYKNFFLLKLKKLIAKISNKHVELKIINLKKLHLNSDIFLQSIAIKLKNRKNRLYKVLKKVFKLINLPVLNKYEYSNHESKKNKFNLTNLNSLLFFKKNYLQELLLNPLISFNNKYYHSIVIYNIKKFILNSLRHKYINGVRLESKGRLTKRLTAQRSVFKLKYKGNLKNIDSYDGISTTLLKGYSNSNLQYTNINNKTRNGSFGLKGWISSF